MPGCGHTLLSLLVWWVELVWSVVKLGLNFIIALYIFKVLQ